MSTVSRQILTCNRTATKFHCLRHANASGSSLARIPRAPKQIRFLRCSRPALTRFLHHLDILSQKENLGRLSSIRMRLFSNTVAVCLFWLAILECFPLREGIFVPRVTGRDSSLAFASSVIRNSRSMREAHVHGEHAQAVAPCHLRLRGGADDDDEPQTSGEPEEELDEAELMRAFGMQPIPDEPEDLEKKKTEYLSLDTSIGRWGWTALHRAASMGDAETLAKMCSMGGDVNADTQSGWTPLHEAANWGQVEAAKVLLANGAKVNQTNKNDWTALHFAAGSGQVEMIKLLLEAGIERDAMDNYGDKAVDKALRSAQPRYPCCPPGMNLSATSEERRARYLEAARLLLDAGGEEYVPSDERFDVYAKLLPGRRYAYDLDGFENESYVDTADEMMAEDADGHNNFRIRSDQAPDEDDIDWDQVRVAAANATNATDLANFVDSILLQEDGEHPPTGAMEGVLDEYVKAEIEGWAAPAYDERINNPKGIDRVRKEEMWEDEGLAPATKDDMTPPALPE